MFRHNCIKPGLLKKFFFLFKQIVNISTQSQNISDETRILTSDASKLTPENITSATRVVGQIFNKSRNALPEVKLTLFLRGEWRREGRKGKMSQTPLLVPWFGLGHSLDCLKPDCRALFLRDAQRNIKGTPCLNILL